MSPAALKPTTAIAPRTAIADAPLAQEEPPQPGSLSVRRAAHFTGSQLEVVGRLPEGVAVAPLERLTSRLLRRLGQPRSTVTVRFAGDRTVRRYNAAYRQIDRTTDVLSFALGDAIDGVTHLGDLLISRERVRVQARRAGLSPQREMAELLIHGVLHLLGHDHEQDAGEMDHLELTLRGELLADRGLR